MADLTRPGKQELTRVISEHTGVEGVTAERLTNRLIIAYITLNPAIRQYINNVDDLTRDDHADICAGLIGIEQGFEPAHLARILALNAWTSAILDGLHDRRRKYGIEGQTAAVFALTPPTVTNAPLVAAALNDAFGIVHRAREPWADLNADGLAHIMAATIELQPNR